MKRIVATLALALCIMHNCSAMFNPIRQNIGRFGQYARQYAQQAAPTTCRTFASRASRPQNFGWLRNLPTYARNANLPSMRTAAVGLGGLGLGTAAYLQRPELFARVQAEEQNQSTILDDIQLKLKSLATNKTMPDLDFQQELNHLKTKLNLLTFESAITDRKKFASIVNDILNLENKSLFGDLLFIKKEAGSFEKAALILLAQAIHGDITLANAVHDLADVPGSGDPTVKLEIPDKYRNFFRQMSKNKDDEFKQYFIKAIYQLNQPMSLHEIIENDDSNISDEAKVLRYNRSFQNQHKLLKQISDILEGKSSSWWWPF